MTQHITVTEVTPEGVVKVDPEISPVWRDDQLIMWMLAPGLKWPDQALTTQPIVFPSDSGWPGAQPSPIGEVPGSGPDRRNYIVLCGYINDGPKPITYRYNITALHMDTVIDDPKELKWTDPDVENRPLP
jgi:hypothetical protein